MKKKKSKLLTLLLVLLALTGCKDDKDGDWTPMAWRNVNFVVNDGENYFIDENGGTFTFECTNYKSFWIDCVLVSGEDRIITDEGHISCKGEWFEMEIQGNKFIITIDPKPASIESRALYVHISVGDTGTSFTFRQQKDE